MPKQYVAYIAGPFRAASVDVPGHQDMFKVQQNIMRAMEVALQAWRAGFAVCCPHSNTMFFTASAPDSVWLEGDLELMRRSDVVILTPDWQASSGARAEVEEAKRVGIPHFVGVEKAIMWRDHHSQEGR